MKIDFSLPVVRNAIVKFTETGAKSDCPFCAGRMITSVSAGETIIVLQGMYSGRVGKVSDRPGFSDDEFIVHFDLDPQDILTRIGYQRDKFTYFPIKKAPEWLCHLSIDDLSALEESCLDAVLNFAVYKSNAKLADLLLPLFATVRSRRLPIIATDLWPTLVAHGFSKKHKSEFQRYFDFGMELLVSLHGRPSIQRKKMAPMSRGRYLTPGQEKFLGPSPAFTS
jgi:hypothetical protein